MRNQNHDVIMICKGWYDTDKHKSIQDALRQYYMREYDMQEQFVMDLYILEVILLPVVEEYLSKKLLTHVLLSMFTPQYDFIAHRFYVPVEGREIAMKYITNRLITEIARLRIKDSDGSIIIDLPECNDSII